MQLPLDAFSTVSKRARSTAETATALVSTARSAAPALLKETPHLIGAVAGGAVSLATGVLRRLLPGEAFAPDLGEHQVSDVETQRDAVLPPARVAPVAVPTMSEQAVQVGAPGAATAAVDKAVNKVAEQVTPGEVLTHDALPLADFDHLTIGALRTRIRPLDLQALVQLRSYERVHANRLPVMTTLENRIAKLQADSADSGRPRATTAT